MFEPYKWYNQGNSKVEICEFSVFHGTTVIVVQIFINIKLILKLLSIIRASKLNIEFKWNKILVYEINSETILFYNIYKNYKLHTLIYNW